MDLASTMNANPLVSSSFYPPPEDNYPAHNWHCCRCPYRLVRVVVVVVREGETCVRMHCINHNHYHTYIIFNLAASTNVYVLSQSHSLAHTRILFNLAAPTREASSRSHTHKHTDIHTNPPALRSNPREGTHPPQHSVGIAKGHSRITYSCKRSSLRSWCIIQ